MHKNINQAKHNINFLSIYFLMCLITWCFIISTLDLSAQSKSALQIVSRHVSVEVPHVHGSIYVENEGFRLRSGDFISYDNGREWIKSPTTPDFSSGLPYGYRRYPVTSVLDSTTRRIITIINAMDVKDLDPKIHEPPVAQKTYYLRYKVSEDSGKTWRFDEPIIQKGAFNAQHPFPGIFIGRNAIYLGDKGSIPVVTSKGNILVPAQTTILGEDGELSNPGNGHTYTDAVVLIGTWTKDHRIAWTMSERVKGDPRRSSRGMIEPTLLEMKDGRLLMVMRGSNARRTNSDYQVPSYKWFSISKDNGYTWSDPEPFTFEDGTAFYSPSSMSTLFKHSSGRVFWVGNMTEENSRGNLPRRPVVLAEVNTDNLKLIRNSLLVMDAQREEDKPRGRVDMSHFSVIEDRQTKEIILTYPRSYITEKSKEWVTTRIAIN